MKNNISAKELDVLLRHNFLHLDFDNPAHAQMLNSVSQRVMAASFGESSSVKGKLLNRLTFILPATVLIALCMLFANNHTRLKTEKPVAKTITKHSETPVLTAQAERREQGITHAATITHLPLNSEAKHFSSLIPTLGLPVQTPENDRQHRSAIDSGRFEESSAFKANHDDYIFPTLTEKEIKATEKEKKHMAKQAARCTSKKGKDKYPFIPAPSNQSLPDFNMGGAEVTNLEYRTFLFDLLIHEKKEEFLLAKPAQNLWQNAGGVSYFDTLSKVYFSAKEYNDYPVVNISAVGAEMYCAWLSDLANEIRQKEGKPAVRYRLPEEREWLYAANVGHPEAVYPWYTNSVQNKVNCFLANFCLQKQYDAFKQPIIYPGTKIDPGAYTSAGMVLNKRGIATVMVWCYNPNDFYLYATCGNVSEMVYTDAARNRVKTKGGNWNSDFEHLKFNSEDEFKAGVHPSPMIGFRVLGESVK